MEKKEKNNYNDKFYKNKKVEEIEKRLKEIEEELERRLARNIWDNEDLWLEKERLERELERLKRFMGPRCKGDDDDDGFGPEPEL